MSVLLFEHNQKAYDSALSLMAETGKAAVIHPTGTGKSFIGFKLAEQHPGLRICWLSPSEYIFKTQVENLKAAGGGALPNIVFCTYAKLAQLDENSVADMSPGYIVLDEFHRCGAAEWGKGVRRLLAAYPGAPVLGLSATNIRYLDNQRDMADELFDGNIASEITLGEAIVRNILPPPVYIGSIYSYQKDLAKYQECARRAKNPRVRETAQKYIDALKRALEKADGLDTIFEKHIKDRQGKFIVFCANTEHMREMISRAPEWFSKVDPKPHIYSVYSEDSESDKVFGAFKRDGSEHLKLLFCIDMLNEGVHVADISGVILFRPTVSPIVYKQQIGRALSAGKGREPIIFDIVNNFDNLYSIGAVKEEMRNAAGYYRAVDEPGRVINTGFRLIDEVKDCKRLFDGLRDCLSASWEVMLAAAAQYYRAHGDLLAPKKYKTADGLSLGAWVATQRRVRNGYVPGVLTEERIRKLDAVGMVWHNLSDFGFERSYQYAGQYYKAHGDLDAAAGYVTPDGFALGEWLCRLRQSKKGHARCLLTDERVSRLDAIGMIWDKQDRLFESRYRAAEHYYIEYGDLNVPLRYTAAEGIALGAWIRDLRRKRENGKLNGAQAERLDRIGMVWATDYESDWLRCYERASEYYREHGNLDIPAAYKTADGIALGKWIRRHRPSAETGKPAVKLTEERKAKLDAIGMIWRTEDPWARRFGLVKQYFEIHGHVDIPQSYVTEDNVWIGKWLYTQRQVYRGKVKGESLTAGQIDKLDALGMNWLTPAERLFEEYYAAAKAFRKLYGHLDVPEGYVGENGKPLDKWLKKQREKREAQKLTPGQIAMLDAIGMIWKAGGEEQRPSFRRIISA